MTALEAARARRSHPAVTDEAPTTQQLMPLIEAAGSVADHSALVPWRLIEVRGEARERLGRALVEAAGVHGKDAAKLAAKPLRAPLLIALVVTHRPSAKVPEWEQDATAAGVGHLLSLLLDEAGWGVMWRTGEWTRSSAVHRAHGLAANEELMGWLYVGGKREREQSPRKPRVNPGRMLDSL